jgi:hypothetical protein
MEMMWDYEPEKVNKRNKETFFFWKTLKEKL